MRTRGMLIISFCLTAVGALHACAEEGGNKCSSSSPRSPTIIFANCQDNTLLQCVANETGGSEGTTDEVNCSEQGLACLSNTLGLSSCGNPTVGEVCQARDFRVCDDQGDAVQCIWVSEEPEPGTSGEIGIWRLQEDCTMSCTDGTCD